MLISTWNVNSIRTRIEQVEDFLEEVQPDLLCLQETKVEDAHFPKKNFEEKGYQLNFYGQKSYNGVALISKLNQEDVRCGFSGELYNSSLALNLDQQKRIISTLINGIRFINVYVPNGSSLNSEKYNYKLEWLKCLKDYLNFPENRGEPLCILGDFNIALEDKDIHNPERLSGGIMASKEERNALRHVLGERLEDIFRIFEQDTNHWSWWDYRSGAWQRDKGWRIDHIYLSNEILNNAKSCIIHKKVRGNIQPSDHAPVIVDINWPPEENEELADFFY